MGLSRHVESRKKIRNINTANCLLKFKDKMANFDFSALKITISKITQIASNKIKLKVVFSVKWTVNHTRGLQGPTLTRKPIVLQADIEVFTDGYFFRKYETIWKTACFWSSLCVNLLLYWVISLTALSAASFVTGITFLTISLISA